MLAELGGGAVLETRMWPYGIVMPTPDFDQDARFDAVAKPLHVQTLVAEFAVEALVVAILPRLARIDQGGVDLGLGEPQQDPVANEFRAVVRTKEQRRTMYADQAGEHVNDASGTDASGYVDGEALAGELVDHGEAFELLSVGTGVVDEIVGPHLIRPRRGQWPRSRSGYPSPRSAPWQLQPGDAPQPIRALRSHRMTLPAQKDVHAAITVARIRGRDPSHRIERRRIALGTHRTVFQYRTGQFDQLAGLALGMPTLHRQSHLVPADLRAHHFRRLISFSVSIDNSRSATMRLSLTFSISNSRNRFTSAGCSVPNRRRHTQIVCSLILCFLATSTTGLRSASRRIATICSSVNRTFFISSSLRQREPSSQVIIGPKNPGRSSTPPEKAWPPRRIALSTTLLPPP